ncbi:MAG TPA: hypothetical protein VN081_05855 [Dongiaceae bacterium]|nr:hypothetical protein [Dongiaceae bacterium]
MPRRFNKRTTQLHDVKYPGFPTRTLHIIIDNYELAQKGDEGMQAFFIRQYKAMAKISGDIHLEWDKLQFKAIGIPVGPTPEVKKPNTRLPGGAPVPKPATYGCTCEAPACGSCDQDRHQDCRYGCQFGQIVR